MNPETQTKQRVIKKIKNYKIATRGRDILDKANVLLIVGVTGAGKNSIIQELLKTGKYHYIVSHTTRPPRKNQGVMEKNGTTYHFISWDEAGRLLDQKKFIEAKYVHGLNMYGTGIDEIEAAVRNKQWAVTDIDVEGVEEYKKIKPKTVAVFVLPPSFEVWQKRVTLRHLGIKRHEIELVERKKTALMELERAMRDGYFEFVINHDVKQAAKEVQDIVNGRHEKKQEQIAENLARQLRSKIQKELQLFT